jgi:hypothetical protein
LNIKPLGPSNQVLNNSRDLFDQGICEFHNRIMSYTRRPKCDPSVGAGSSFVDLEDDRVLTTCMLVLPSPMPADGSNSGVS